MVCSILCQHPAMYFRRFNPLCPQKTYYGALLLIAQSLSGADILLRLLPSAMWLNDGMLRAASYTSSLEHMWCCASAPLSCFYRAISKLPTYKGRYPSSKTVFLLKHNNLYTDDGYDDVDNNNLLGKDHEINDYTTSIARRWLRQQTRKQQFHGNNCTATEERCFLRGPCQDFISRAREQ
jgi:hypothetical protein